MRKDPSAALLVVDVQNYYLDPDSSFHRYSERCWPGCMGYIGRRVEASVFPAVTRLRQAFSAVGWPTVYLRLCASAPDRSDLHRFFRTFNESAARQGYEGAYPLSGEAMADVPDEIAPRPGDVVLDKSTYSGFSNPRLEEALRGLGVSAVVMTGLATSQCVDTTARQASERGFTVVHVEDGQADYNQDEHDAALFASRGVCGGHVVESEFLAAAPLRLVRAYVESEGR